uniref:Poly(A)-specific ribonuclease PARN n=1 Tax=Lygus hesperus TaxID=30085 RepID=A0A0A9X7M0_LYGHE
MNSRYVKCTLPLGFETYDPLTLIPRYTKSKSSNTNYNNINAGPQHEAGYDALMTGVVLLNLFAELGYTNGVSGVSTELHHKLALFRSLYAVDVASAECDEYLTTDVLDL